MKRIFIDKKDGKVFGFKHYNRSDATFQQMEVIDGKFKPMQGVEVYSKKRDFIKDDYCEILPNKIHLEGGGVANLWVNNPNAEFMYLIDEEEVAYDKKLFRRAIRTEYMMGRDMLLWSINDFAMCFRLVAGRTVQGLGSVDSPMHVGLDFGSGKDFSGKLEWVALPKEEAKATETEMQALVFYIQAVDGIIIHEMPYHTVNKMTLAEDKGVCWEGQDINPALLYFVSDTNASKYVRLHENKFSIIDVVAILKTYYDEMSTDDALALLENESGVTNLTSEAYRYRNASIVNNERFKQIYNTNNNGKQN